MSVVVGIDPGLSGAIAVMATDGQLLSVVDMPVADKRVSAGAVADQLRIVGQTVDLVAVEAVHSMPRQGVSSTFTFGAAVGVVIGVVGTLGIRLEQPTPAVWKRHVGLIGADKDRSRRLAQERWPHMAHHFARVRDDGRADAAHIAAWALTRLHTMHTTTVGRQNGKTTVNRLMQELGVVGRHPLASGVTMPRSGSARRCCPWAQT